MQLWACTECERCKGNTVPNHMCKVICWSDVEHSHNCSGRGNGIVSNELWASKVCQAETNEEHSNKQERPHWRQILQIEIWSWSTAITWQIIRGYHRARTVENQSKDPLMLKINECLAVMGNPDMDQVLDSRTFGPNDVYLWKLQGNIWCCHGCQVQINKVVQQYLVDIMFQLKTKINIRVGNSNNWLPVNAQVYFHLNMKSFQ